MKLKGVNPFEQHVEKIVLVSVSAVLLVVVALQFLLEPNQIKVQGTSATVAPGPAFRPVEDKAKILATVMDRGPTDLAQVLPPAQKYDLVNQLRTVREAPIAPAQIAMLGPKMAVEGAAGSATATGSEKLNPVAVPAPTEVLVAVHRATISPTEPVNIPGLKGLVPAEQPFDKASVSVEFNFDGTALRAALAAPGDSKAIPASWWRDAVEVMGVKVERQERMADGTWGEPVVVPPAPGKFDLSEQLRTVRSPVELADAVFEARSAAEDICRPAYYSQVAGPEWAPPSKRGAAILTPEVLNEIRRNVAAITTHDRRLETLRQNRANAEAGTVRQPGGGRDGGGGGGGGGKGGAGGGAPGQQPTGPGRIFPTEDDKQRVLKNLDAQISAAEAERQKTVDALKAYNRDETGLPLAAPEPVEGEAANVAKPLLDDPAVKLWSHDMTVTPGKTYRYRAAIGISNPMFARTSALVAEQQPLAAAAVAYGAPSEWSEPIDVLPDQFYFITSAQEAGQLGDQLAPPRATAEVFRFFYGYYRKTSVSLEPGDVIATSIRLPDVNKLPIFDLAAAIPEGGSPAPDAPQPAAPPGGGGKGGGRIADEGGGRGDGRGGAQPGEPEQTVVALPANAKPYPNATIPALIDVLMLDVTKSIGSEAGGQPQAVVRAEGGSVVLITPDEQRKLPSYQMAAASAKEGETQGQPVIPPPKKEPIKRERPGRDGPTAPPPGSGGGGGAGGG